MCTFYNLKFTTYNLKFLTLLTCSVPLYIISHKTINCPNYKSNSYIVVLLYHFSQNYKLPKLSIQLLHGRTIILSHKTINCPNNQSMFKQGSRDLNYKYHHFTVTMKKIISTSRQPPTKKYTFPQTSSQEIGWISTPLVS